MSQKHVKNMQALTQTCLPAHASLIIKLRVASKSYLLYIHTHTYKIHMHTYTSMYIHTHIYTPTYIHIHTYAHTYLANIETLNSLCCDQMVSDSAVAMIASYMFTYTAPSNVLQLGLCIKSHKTKTKTKKKKFC